MEIDTLRVYTGITEDMLADEEIFTLAAMYGVTSIDLDPRTAWLIGADMAEAMAARQLAQAHVSQVEDIGIDHGRPYDMWMRLAERLRARADALDDPGGMTVVEFRPDGWGGIEAVEDA